MPVTFLSPQHLALDKDGFQRLMEAISRADFPDISVILWFAAWSGFEQTQEGPYFTTEKRAAARHAHYSAWTARGVHDITSKCKGTEGKYGGVATTVGTFHEGEPVFLFRATDPLTVRVLERYAHLATLEGCDKAFIDDVNNRAHIVKQWQVDNPTLVKERPD